MRKKNKNKRIIKSAYLILFLALILSISYIIAPIFTSEESKLKIEHISFNWEKVKCTGLECSNITTIIKENLTNYEYIFTPKGKLYWTSSDYAVLSPSLRVYTGLLQDYKNRKDMTSQLIINKTGNGASTKVYSVSLITNKSFNFFQLGNNTIVDAYQNESRVTYSDENNLTMNITLKKFVNGNWVIAPEDIWINTLDGRMKFGANDTIAKETTKYQYEWVSNKPISYDGYYYFDEIPSDSWRYIFYNERIKLITDDICTPQANCTFILENNYTQEGMDNNFKYGKLTLQFYGFYNSTSDIIFIDPELVSTYTASSSGYYNLTNATNLGVSLLFNNTLYPNLEGDYRSLVYYNNTGTYWNMTFRTADSNGSDEAFDICSGDANCISFWRLDEITQSISFADSKGVNTGACHGTVCPNVSSGISSGSQNFDGTNDKINITSSNNLIPTNTTPLTVSGWVNADTISATANYNRMFTLLRSSGSTYASIGLGSSDNVDLAISGTAVSSNTLVSVGNWYHLALTFNGTNNWTLYINGNIDKSSAIIPTTPPSVDISEIGASTPLGYYFDGKIDDVLLMNRSLTPSEVKALYKAGLSQHANTNITAYTRMASEYNTSDANLISLWTFNDGTLNDTMGQGNFTNIGGATYNSTVGVVDGSYRFDGVNNYLNMTADNNIYDLTDDITIVGWIYPTRNVVHTIFRRGSGASGGDYAYFLQLNGGVARAGVYTNAFKVSNATHVNPLNKWVMVSMTFDKDLATNQLKVYENDQWVGSATASGLAQSTNPKMLTIGSLPTELPPSGNTTGNIDEVRLYNRALTQTEIQDLYELGAYHLNWNGGEDNWTEESLVTNEETIQTKSTDIFMQFKLLFKSNDTISSAYLLNHTIEYGQKGAGGDTTPPFVNITYPLNNTNYSINVSALNYTTTDDTGLSRCLYSRDYGKTNSTTTGANTNFTGVTSIEGWNNWTVFCNDTSNNWNYSRVWFFKDTQPPNVTYAPINSTIEFNRTSLLVNFTATDISPFSFVVNDTTNFQINASGFLQNKTSLAVGIYNLNITINDSYSQNTSVYYKLNVSDTSAPNCVILSRIPNDINDSSTGVLNIMINCTDESGINVSKSGDHYGFFITRTVDAFILSAGVPNYWSNRYPNNSLGVIGTLTPPYKIWRALGRNEGYWYEGLNGDMTDCTGINPCYRPMNDTFSYAIEDGEYGHFSTLQGLLNKSVVINYTHPAVDISAFRQSVYISYESMVKEGKKNFTIRNNNYVIMKRFDAEAYRNTDNYTMNSFRNFVMEGVPSKTLRAHYCNSSILNSSGDIPNGFNVIGNPNCALISSLTSVEINNRIATDRNSSWSKGTYGITNFKFGGIQATTEFLIEYESPETGTNKGYNLQYVNGTTNTNLAFNDSKVAWYTTNGGTTWIQAQWTPDVMTTTVRQINDQFQFGSYMCDSFGNCLKNFTMIMDDITQTNHPITFPIVLEYNSSATSMDENLSGYHKGVMNILVGTSKDPDSVGNVTHNLTLRNLDGTLNYTINASFKSPTDADMWINFNTSLVPDGLYRMNITAISGDNPLDIKGRLTERNFTIDNTFPIVNITQPFNNTWYSTDIFDLKFTIIEANLQSCKVGGLNTIGDQNNISWTCGENFTSYVSYEGNNTIWYWATDLAGHESGIRYDYYVDTINPTIDYTTPTESSGVNVSRNWTYVNVTFNETNLKSIRFSIYTSAGAWNSTSFNISTYSINWTNLPNNDYWYQVNITDIVDHENATEVRYIRIDTNNPNATLSSLRNSTYTNITSQNITTNLTDNLGIKNATISIYNQSGLFNSTAVSFIANTIDKKLGIVFNFVDNAYTWFVELFDWAGNYFKTGNYTFTVDTISPRYSVISLIPNPAELGINKVYFNWTTNDSNLQYAYFEITNLSNYPFITNNITQNATIQASLFPRAGNYTFKIYTNDSAGNLNSTSVNLLVNDTIPPFVNITQPLNNSIPTSRENLNLTILATDFSIITCKYSLNGASNISLSCTNGTNSYLLNGSQEGDNKIYFYVTDSEGNMNFSRVNYHVNTQNKTMLISIKEQSLTPTDPINISATCRWSNGTICNYDVYCRASLWLPNQTIILEEQLMSNMTIGIYNYSLNALGIEGDYSGIVACYNNNYYEEKEAFSFPVATEKIIDQSTSTTKNLFYSLNGEDKINLNFLIGTGLLLLFIIIIVFAIIIDVLLKKSKKKDLNSNID